MSVHLLRLGHRCVLCTLLACACTSLPESRCASTPAQSRLADSAAYGEASYLVLLEVDMPQIEALGYTVALVAFDAVDKAATIDVNWKGGSRRVSGTLGSFLRSHTDGSAAGEIELIEVQRNGVLALLHASYFCTLPAGD